jgi:DNA-binding XRE family transcriptional regulator
MRKKANNNLYDVSAELEREFGPVGSAGWNKAIEQAWAEYNAEILLETRKKARMTQAQVAERIGATKSYISRVERGQIVPTATSFFRIVNALGYSVELVPAVMRK